MHWCYSVTSNSWCYTPQVVNACLEVTDAIVAINPSAYYGSIYVNLITGKLSMGHSGPGAIDGTSESVSIGQSSDARALMPRDA